MTEAIVTTAVPLPDDLETKLAAELARLFGKKVRDPQADRSGGSSAGCT